MYIQLSELKTNPAKYFDLAKTCDIIVTRHGKRLGRIIPEEKAVEQERMNAFDELMQFVKTAPSVPDKTVYDEEKEERLRERTAVMRVVIDNNVIIDALKPNPQFEAAAQQILQLASLKSIDGFVSANSLTDIFYVLRKGHGADKAKVMTQKLLLILNVIGIDPIDCIDALSLPMNDFEDAMVAVCAKKVKADFIVTRDERFIKDDTEVRTVSPEQLIEEIRSAAK